MDINVRNSCTGKSWHIHNIYFFIKYRVEKGYLSVMYCPTRLMLADYFMKTLQETLFHKFRYIIVVRVSIYTMLKEITSYSSKEHVENQITRKQIPSKKQIPQKEPNTIEYEKGK